MSIEREVDRTKGEEYHYFFFFRHMEGVRDGSRLIVDSRGGRLRNKKFLEAIFI